MPTSLPVYQPYGTVQNSYNELMGQPINYNVPLSSLRSETSAPSISTFGNGSNQDQVNNRAQSIANISRAKTQARYTAYGDTIKNNLSLLDKLDVGHDTASNLYSGAYDMGLVNERGPGFTNQSQFVPGSSQARGEQANRDLNYANTQANLILGGVNPQEVQKAYTKFLKKNQF